MPSLKAIANKVLVEKYGVTHLALNAIRFLLIRKKKQKEMLGSRDSALDFWK